jgi:hypothetical protein
MTVGNGEGGTSHRRSDGWRGVALIQYRPKSGTNCGHRAAVTIEGNVATTITATMLGLGREELGQVGTMLYILGTRGKWPESDVASHRLEAA